MFKTILKYCSRIVKHVKNWRCANFMNEKLFEEDLSISYLRAIAAQSKITFELRRRDENSIDAQLSKMVITDEHKEFYAMFNVQLKATCSTYEETDSSIKYPLKVKNYNDLRRKSSNSIILCLLILPEESSEWLLQTPEELALRKCMYWISLRDYPDTSNASTVTIEIPKTNVVSQCGLNEMMHIIANGGEL